MASAEAGRGPSTTAESTTLTTVETGSFGEASPHAKLLVEVRIVRAKSAIPPSVGVLHAPHQTRQVVCGPSRGSDHKSRRAEGDLRADTIFGPDHFWPALLASWPGPLLARPPKWPKKVTICGPLQVLPLLAQCAFWPFPADAKVGARRVGPAFFPLPPQFSFFLSLGCLCVEFWCFLKRRGLGMCTFGLRQHSMCTLLLYIYIYI